MLGPVLPTPGSNPMILFCHPRVAAAKGPASSLPGFLAHARRARANDRGFEIDQAVHIVSGGERASSLLVLEDAALKVVGNAGVQRPRETAHDLHPFVAGVPQGRLRRSDNALKPLSPKIGILRAAATRENDRKASSVQDRD